jgi:hypothetical protein
MGFYEVLEMPYSDFVQLHKALEVIKAENRLEEIGVSNFSDLKQDAKDKIRRHYHKLSRPNLFESDSDKRENSTKEAFEQLRGAIGR